MSIGTQTIKEKNLTMRRRLRIIVRRRLRTVYAEQKPVAQRKGRGIQHGVVMTKKEAVRMNISVARAAWGRLSRAARDGLNELTTRYGLSVALGDVPFIDGRWYVT